MKILVTRPLLLAAPLCQKMKEAGFTSECFPVIEIIPTPYQAALREHVQKLPQVDIAIFISRSAAYYGGQAILERWKQFPKLLYFAIGPGTKQTLQQLDCPDVLISSPPFESESLLKHPALQAVQEKRIVIFQGNGGRALLFETLARRLACVTPVECYQRQLPMMDRLKQPARWHSSFVDGILLTSREGLQNLQTLAGVQGWMQCRRLPFVVVGPRLQKEAQHLGVQHIVIARAADDATLIEALIEMRKQR